MVWLLVRPLFRAVIANSKSYSAPKRIFNNKNYVFLKTYCTQIQPTDESEDPFDKIVATMAKGDAEIENKLRLYMLEMDMLRQNGSRSPDVAFMKKQYWDHLLVLQTRSQRQRYYAYIFELQMKAEKKKAKQIERAKELEEVRETMKVVQKEKFERDDFVIEYGLRDLAMFLRIYQSVINKGDNARLHQAAMYGQKLVIDCSYDNHMTFREQSNAGNQLTMLFADNRIHREPFDMHFCNVDHDTETLRKLKRNIPTWNEPAFPINIHTESYLDLFPKEKLVYLTPHCRTELTEFDDDAIYIIGCMVDKSQPEPLSLGKAKQHDLKVAKLPLDRYLQWNSGSGKSLTLDQVLNILLDIKSTRDWVQALKHVPRRKVVSQDSLQNVLYKSKNAGYMYTSRNSVKENLWNKKNKSEDFNEGSMDDLRGQISKEKMLFNINRQNNVYNFKNRRNKLSNEIGEQYGNNNNYRQTYSKSVNNNQSKLNYRSLFNDDETK